MTSALADEVRAVRDLATRFFTESAPLARRQEHPRSWRELHGMMARLDFFAGSLLEGADEDNLSVVIPGVLAEAAGAELAPGPILDQLIALRMTGGCEELSRPLAAGQHRAAVHMRSPQLDQLRYDSSSMTLSGIARGMHIADGVNRLLVQLPKRVVVVDSIAVRELTPERTIDPSWASISARFEDTPVVGAIDRSPSEREADCAFAAGLVAAMSVGSAGRVLADTVVYAKNRHQFGRPIGSFQAIKHKLADAYIALLHTRSLTYAALAKADDHLMTVARVAADRCYREAAETALQVHGGIGFTTDSTMHLFLKNAQQLRRWPVPVQAELERLRAHLKLDHPSKELS
jgi:hypothetical protein